MERGSWIGLDWILGPRFLLGASWNAWNAWMRGTWIVDRGRGSY